MKYILAIIIFAALFAGVTPSFAARPLITDDFFTLTQNVNEIEFGYLATKTHTSLVHSYDLLLRRGLLTNFELALEMPYTFSPVSGFNDCFVHLKYRFWDMGLNEGLTARADIKFYNGDINNGLGSGDNDYWLVLIYSKMLGKSRAHINLGYVNVGFNAGRTEAEYLAYTAAVEYPLWGSAGDLVAEYVANTSLSPNPTFIQVGARYEIMNSFKLDAGYSTGINSNSIKNALTMGIHWDF